MGDSGSMRVLVCPDKFAGTLTAGAAAQAISEGWRDARPDDDVTVRPLADGGPGFLDVLEPHLPEPVRLEVPAAGPFGDPTSGTVLVAGGTAYLESAQVCGLDLVPPPRRDPTVTTTYGVGMLVAGAIRAGVTRVVLGLGGSGTNDGGAGMLAALGAVPVDAAGAVLPYGGAALAYCTGLRGAPALAGVALVGATDVAAELTGPRGASVVFGPQKGASPEQVALLDAALARFASVLERCLSTCPSGLHTRPGSGAAGGLGAAVLACGGELAPGFEVVGSATGLDSALADCDIVLTGEGSFDDQSLMGKAVGSLARAAQRRGRPCLVLAGRVSLDEAGARSAGVSRSYGLVNQPGIEADLALSRPAEALRALAARVARDQ